MRMSGAILMGKTVTTEFAHRHPGATANPANPAHTPGGSSSGSAAAVAAGMTPLAFGSQTTGSVIRPAAYCGVVGYKPTHGQVNASGMMANTPSFDTVGLMSQHVDDLVMARGALLAESVNPLESVSLRRLHRSASAVVRFGLRLATPCKNSSKERERTRRLGRANYRIR